MSISSTACYNRSPLEQLPELQMTHEATPPHCLNRFHPQVVTMGSAKDCDGEDKAEKMVALMRKIVEQKDSDGAKDVDDSTIRRFLNARDLDVDKAANFLLKHLAWKREAIPNGFISESEVQKEIAQQKMFSQGFDKMGRPIGVVLGCKHDARIRDLNEFKRFVVYIIDKLCSRMERNQEKFTIIADLQGWGYSNCDIRAYISALDILQG